MVGINTAGALDPTEIYKALLAMQAGSGGGWPASPLQISQVQGSVMPQVALPPTSMFAQAPAQAPTPQYVPQQLLGQGQGTGQQAAQPQAAQPNILSQLMQSFQNPSGSGGGGGGWDTLPTKPATWSQFLQLPQFDRNSTTQSPLESVASGVGNFALNLPRNSLGKVLDAAQWLVTPQNQQEGAQPTSGPDNSGFRPGLPSSKINAVENSTGNPAARNPNSSAMGNGQFIKSTWMDFIKAQHPDLMKTQNGKQLLQLRANPQMSAEATSWYAGQAVDALDKLNLPASDTNVYLHHFLGPAGMTAVLTAKPGAKAESFLPAKVIAANQSVLKGKTAQDIIDWAAVKMGEFQGGPPPARHQIQSPNFDAARQWFDAAQPQAPDQQQLKNAQFAMLLSGFGQGVGAANVTQPGGVGRMFADMAGGTAQGLSKGQNLALQLGQNFKDKTSAYDLGRGTFAQKVATDKTAVANTNADRAFNDSIGAQNYKLSQSATNALATQPKVLSSSPDGLWIQQPGGQPTYMPTPSGAGMSPADLQKTASTFGADSGAVQGMKYNLMVQDPNMNLFTMQREIIRDLISAGQGPSVFGQAYTDAAAEAEKQATSGLAAGSQAAKDLQDKTISGILLGVSQRDKNYEWLLTAASLGNPGAMMLVQNGMK